MEQIKIYVRLEAHRYTYWVLEGGRYIEVKAKWANGEHRSGRAYFTTDLPKELRDHG